MTILKNLYRNYQNKFYYTAENIFYNLNRKRCESSYFLLLCYNVNIMESNNFPTTMDYDSDCIIVCDTELNKNNNMNVLKTASEIPSVSTGHCDTCSSNTVSSLCTSRRQTNRPNRSVQGRNKESTSISMGNRKSSHVTMNFNSNLVLNPFYFKHFNDFQSFYHSRGLAQFIPPVHTEQRFNYSTQKFRNASLFSEQETVSSGSQPVKKFNEHHGNWRELQDKEIANNLRRWITVNESVEPVPGVQFVLMSYNVLAQNLLVEHEYLYRKHHPRALLWENRWKTLYKEISDHKPDIFCLQEVQENHLENYYSQFLKKGYAHIYKKKTGMRSDGCAIYYKKSLFKLIENTTVELNQGHFTLDRDNVAIVAKFAPVQQFKSEFVVVTTHLLFNPRREDVRLAQIQVLLAEVERIAYTGNRNNTYLPIIITGDFNTPPYNPVYNLVTNGTFQYEYTARRTLKPSNYTEGLTGKVLIPPTLRITDNCKHFDLLEARKAGKKLSRANELQIISLRHSKRKNEKEEKMNNNLHLFSTGTLSHDLKLQSAFSYTEGNDTEVTTHQDKWINVDYIFYSGVYDDDLNKICESKLKIISRYSIPTSSEMEKVRYIPNFAFGSDHLSLLVKFKLED